MCGILAQFTSTGKVNTNLFTTALSLLNHRGPDENDVVLLREDSLCLGHTRLSIVGINNGQQPLNNPEKTLYTIINGEFYDYKTIKHNFALEGYNFITETDSEIILPLYQKYKYDCFKQLNGEFAGIIYDVAEDKLVIFRDRHGVKPLYFKHNNQNIIFSSEIKSILKLENQQPEWNIDYLKQFNVWVNIADNTIFKDIYHVKPGHYMILDCKNNQISEHCYWQIDFPKDKYFDDPLEKLVEQYKKEFVSAVDRRLVADVPVATYLSGGIDSSACYGVASHLQGRGVDAFTISFESNSVYDEFEQAQKLVKKYGGKHHVLKIDDKILFENFEKHLWHMEGPVLNPHSVAKYLLSQKVLEAGFKVVITGEGSDEYNAGYAPSVIDAAKFEYKGGAKLSDELLKVSSGAMLSKGSKELPYIKEIYGFSPNWIENSAVDNLFFNSLYATKYKSLDTDLDLKRWTQKLYRPEMKNWDALNTSLYLTGKFTFAYVLSVLGDRTEMAHSVEARVPFLDHNLLEFLAKVPPKYKATLEKDKFLLRESLKQYVTLEHYNTPKHPYLSPPLITKNSIFADYMHDVFSSKSFINSGLFDHKKVQETLYELLDSGKANPGVEKHLFRVLSFAVLHKMFNFKDLPC